jgi:hypothetical protein
MVPHRVQVDAVAQTGGAKSIKKGPGHIHHVPVIRDLASRGRRAKVEGKPSPQSLDASKKAEPLHDLVDATLEPPPAREQILVATRLIADVEEGKAGHNCRQMGVVGAAVLGLAQRRNVLHDLAPAAKNAEGQPPTDGLAQRAQV